MREEIAMVCRHVAGGAPILFAARDEVTDPAAFQWRFLCGAAAHIDADQQIGALEEVVRLDPSAVEIVLHPAGTVLERTDAAARWRTEAGPVLFPRRPSRRYPRFDPRYAPRPGEPLEASDLRLLADVSQRGWHCVVVAPEEPALASACSVGLFRSFDHPEVAVFGLAPDVLEAAVERIAKRVRDGERFEGGDLAEGVLDDRPVAFRPIVPRHYPARLGYAVWYHGGPRFPALQCVWANPDGHFPWDRWFPRELRDAQPVLFEPEPA
jgi:hypothetical protein